MKLVTLSDVGVAYDGYEALQHVDLEIDEHDFLGIIGPNGGGKTSLVKAILGTIPYSGNIRMAPELFRGRERLIGYMPQITNFDRAFPISVHEVVLSGLQGRKGFRSRYSREDRNKAMDLIREVGIGEVACHPIGEISGGQMQRALLARAIISEPRLLILDEPTNFVDNRFEKELYTTLQRAQRTYGHHRRLARHRNHHQRREGDRMRQPPCAQAQVEHPDAGAVAELRLSDTDRLPRNRPPHRAGTPSRRLLSGSRLNRLAA